MKQIPTKHRVRDIFTFLSQQKQKNPVIFTSSSWSSWKRKSSSHLEIQIRTAPRFFRKSEDYVCGPVSKSAEADVSRRCSHLPAQFNGSPRPNAPRHDFAFCWLEISLTRGLIFSTVSQPSFLPSLQLFLPHFFFFFAHTRKSFIILEHKQ